MCGITGFYVRNSKPDSDSLIERMVASLKHRGPDAQDVFVDRDTNLFLAHSRLSILELSDAGAQPMRSKCGRFVIVFNGEIYNFEELRAELKSIDSQIIFDGHSDTEVLLRCIQLWGFNQTLIKLNGMFAIAVFDKARQKLLLARDRFGEKPLYFFSDENSFVFASELKPIRQFRPELPIDPSAVNALFRYSYIPAPFSIYEGVYKLLPGHLLEISLSEFKRVFHTDSIPYWKIGESIHHSLSNAFDCRDEAGMIKETERILTKSVSDRMVSDVPLGAFLSGGIDSTCITALMQKASTSKIQTFSIGFYDDQYNEAHHAKAVSEVLGTDHNELYIQPKDMLDVVPHLHEIYDEPFSDSSQLPTYLVSKFARSKVTVALTGDAGDEVFGGYNRYLTGNSVANSFGKIPTNARKLISGVGKKISPDMHNRIFSVISHLLSKEKRYKNFGDKAHKLYRVMDFKSQRDLYEKLILTWPETAVTGSIDDFATDIEEAFNSEGISFIERMMWQDAVGYLQNDILAKVDRASMACSLETRIPFIDNEVFAHAWSLPIEEKIKSGQTKYPLKKIVSSYVPDEITNRAKSGFGAPIGEWLRGDLRDWAEALLSEEALNQRSFLDTSKIRQLWKAHLTGKVNEQHALWNVLMFQQWVTES